MLTALNSKIITALSALAFISVILSSCSGGPQSTGPGIIVVTVSPGSVTLAAGATQQFTAIVSGTTNSKVTWQVNGAAGGNSTIGTISSGGLYTAPATIPGASITVTAVSAADATVSASAIVNFTQSITLSLAPTASSVPVNGSQLFTVTISGAPGGASLALAWSVNGIPSGNNTLGSISSNSATTAVYVAPLVIPKQNPITITVESVSNILISAKATVTITCGAANSITPSSASVILGGTQSFSASLCFAQGDSLTWDVNGISGGNSTVGAIAVTSSSGGSSTATYTAPTALPSPSTVTIHASTGSGSAAASVTLANNVSISLAPATATVAPLGSVTLTPTVTGSTNANVTWTVNGIANGNSTVGQICEAGSSPCTTPAGGFAGSVAYVAPASVPSQNPVSVVATSVAAPTQTAASTITVSSGTNTAATTVAPLYLFIAATGGAPSTQQFFAQDLSGANAPVSWSVASAVAGTGCSASACGTITASGLYTAPSNAPLPNAISVIATASSNPPAIATANVAVISGVTIEAILPSSVTAGSVEGFPLELQGVNFVQGSGAAASVILINGAARPTTCPSSNSCATPLNPSDVAAAATLTLQIQNPNGALSNPVPFVVAPIASSPSALHLSSAQASTKSIQLTAAEPTTAASSSPTNVNFIGMLADNDCTIGAAPLTVTRPASGTSIVSICVQGDGLDPTFTFSFGGPAAAPDGTDIPVTASAVPGLLPNMIQLDLELSSGAAPGLRTLFISTLNGDRATATGMLEIQ